MVPCTQGQSTASRGRCPTAATHPDELGSPSPAHSQPPGARGPCSASIHVTSQQWMREMPFQPCVQGGRGFFFYTGSLPGPPPGPQPTEGAASPETPDSARAQSTQARRCEPCIMQPFRVTNETKNDLPSRAGPVTRPGSPAGTSPGLWPSEEGRASRSRRLAGVSRGEGSPSPCRGRGTRNIIQQPLLGSPAHPTSAVAPGQ